MLQTWKVTLEYDGTRYSGWQDQKNAPRTVMGELRKAFETVLGIDVEMQGAGRTDAGVHASAQVAHVRAVVKRRFAVGELLRRMNDELPQDIALTEIVEAPAHFHARHDAGARSYVYQISTRKTAFSKKYVWWIKEPLNVERMQEAASKLAGRHDFICFRAKDPSRPDESTIVVVDNAAVERQDDLVLFRIVASHFLWRMVRRLAGVLVKLGKGEITMQDFDKLLAGQCDPRLDVAAWTAPASGLFLENVEYPSKTTQKRAKK